MITNTGFYGAANDKYIPAYAYEATVDELAEGWTREWGYQYLARVHENRRGQRTLI